VSSSKKKILLVDDSSTVLLATRMLLSDYEVVTACDGEEGVAKALAELPDLILLDVIMPKLDGFQACRTLRAREELAELPILMMTTRGEPHNIQAGYECGCTEYITKPFDGAELLARIRNFIGE
jgi:DNA-binding response OmpR family regulator